MTILLHFSNKNIFNKCLLLMPMSQVRGLVNSGIVIIIIVIFKIGEW